MTKFDMTTKLDVIVPKKHGFMDIDTGCVFHTKQPTSPEFATNAAKPKANKRHCNFRSPLTVGFVSIAVIRLRPH